MTPARTPLLAAALLLVASSAAGQATASSHECSHEINNQCIYQPAYIIQQIAEACGTDVTSWATCAAEPPLGPRLCGREALRTLIAAHPWLGECISSHEWVAPDVNGIINGVNDEIDAVEDAIGDIVGPIVGGIVGLILSVPWALLGLIDRDGDLIPDALEPTICFLEDENSNLDGRCYGNDYQP